MQKGKGKKDRYYFQHDYNARNDDSIETMLLDYAAAGYGLYWGIVERLHEEGNSIELNPRFFKSVGKQFMIDADVVEKFINDCCDQYHLFTRSGVMLSADRVQRNLDHRVKVSEERSEAGRKGAIAKKSQAIASESKAKSSKGSAKSSIGKERIEKERRESFPVCVAIAQILGREYVGDPEDRMPGLASWYKEIEMQAAKIIEAYGVETSVRQIVAYGKHCKTSDKSVVTVVYRVAEVILRANWVAMNAPEPVPKDNNPFSEAAFWRRELTDDAWRKQYAKQITTDEKFRKHFQITQHEKLPAS